MTLLAALWWLAALRVTAQLQAPKLNPTDVLRGIVSRLLNWPPVAPLVDASTVQIRAPGAAILRIQRKPDPLEVQGRSADGRSRPHWRRPGLPAKRGNHVRLGGGPLHGWVWRRAVGLALFVVHSVVLAAEPGLAAAREAFDRKTYEAAYSVYLPFAERGYLEAQQHVGHMLELGWGVAPDRAAAARWYALAAAHGEERARADPAALASFAWLLQAGKGLPQDRTKAVGLYAEAAQGGSVVAMYWLGMCHEQGWGTAKNADMAVSWFRRAAALGYVTAQLRLAAYYDKTAGGAPRGGPSRAPEHNAVMAMALRFAKQQRWRATDFGCLAVPPAGAVPRAKPDVPSLDAIGNDGTVLREVADLLSCEGRHGEAEPYFRRSLALREDGWTARRIGTADLMAATLYAKALNNLSVNLIEQRKRDEALPLLLRAVEVLEQARPHANDRGEFGVVSADFGSSFYTIRKNLATLHAKRSEFAEADALFRNLLSEYPTARYESAVLAREWGASLNAAGRHVEAEALFRRALEVFQRLDEPVSATKTEQYLADSLMRQGKAEQARPLFERAAAMWEQREGPDAMSTNKALQELAAAESESGAGAEALEHYRRACDFFRRTSDASARENPTATRAGSRDDLADCEAGKARALFRSAIPVKQAALVEGARAEAFIAAQLAMQSAAGDAMAHSAAKIAASRMGDGALAEAYEQAQQRARTVASALSESYSQPDREASPRRLQLRALLDQAERDRQRVADELQAKAPLYWDFRSPQPVSFHELQSAASAPAAAALLQPNEALVMWTMGTGTERGLVFAVSRERVAWAEMTLAANEIDVRVARLRGQIDPCAYGLTVAPCTSVAPGAQPQSFNRQAAWELHQALLGAPAIRAVTNEQQIDTLIVVPSGSLTTLPPALLISKPPDTAGDDNAGGALREAAWLVKSKAITLLPAAASLRTLRRIPPHALAPGGARTPLFMLANPDFSGRGSPPCSGAEPRSAPKATRAYFRDGRALAEELALLPALPCTAVEAERLRSALGASKQDVLTGAEARESALRKRRDELATARVVAFATHGLVAGDLGLGEPSLVLAPPRRNDPEEAADDGVLSASKVAQLRLTADWVLLSACNTASPDASGAPGLSGLARSFFYAGARSILVSHWRVDDEATQALIATTFERLQARPAAGKALALREAMLSVMQGEDIPASARDAADLKHHRAHPSAWAAFTLIGDPR